MIRLIIYTLIGFAVPCLCMALRQIKPLWRWVEKQEWWKEIENNG